MKNLHIEIERKYLVPHPPADIQSFPTRKIRQGYLSEDDLREVRIRDDGGRYLLAIKEGRGRSRKEIEIPVNHRTFDILWGMTEGRRVEKRRSRMKLQKQIIDLDFYEGELAPLCVAEVEFSDDAAADAFIPPAFFGEEVTDLHEYKNLSLALHGLPNQNRDEYHIGGVPFLIKGGETHVVLVTRSSGNRWIVPKGRPEPGLTHRDVVLMEAVEEAGIIGTLQPGLRASCKTDDGRTLHLYALKVGVLLKKWPESQIRKRIVVPLKEAIEKIGEKAIGRAVATLGERFAQL